MNNNPIKVPKNFSGPERWAIIDQITGTEKTKKSKSNKFKAHQYHTCTKQQLEAYATAITGIKANTGTNKDKRAGRSKGRYIKGKL